VLLAALALFAPQTLTLRTSEIDLTPPEPLPLGGYTARGEHVMEPGGEALKLRTVVFELGETRVALASFDGLTIPESLYAAVVKRIPENVRLMLVATHTHSAPDTQMLNERMTFRIPGIAPFNRRWLDWYADKVASGITSALNATPRPVQNLTLSQVEVDANRGRRPGAKPIQTLTTLLAGSEPILSIYAAHATIVDEKNLKTSSDWPGAYANAVGGLVLPGAIGDASPAPTGDTIGEKLASMVEKLKTAGRAVGVKRTMIGGEVLVFAVEPIQLSAPVPSPSFAAEFGAKPPLDQVLIGRFAPKEASVTLVRIGGLVLVGIPGEPTSEIGRLIQAKGAEAGFPHAIAISHSNGWIGYVLMPLDYDSGGYEGALSFHGRETGLRLVEAVERGFKKLAQAEPRVAQTR
jgi:hypothetical protein